MQRVMMMGVWGVAVVGEKVWGCVEGCVEAQQGYWDPYTGDEKPVEVVVCGVLCVVDGCGGTLLFVVYYYYCLYYHG